jgi:hypothetical protein
MEVVKSNSSKWINETDFLKGKFQMQGGYGAFSISKSVRVIKYIMNQEEHHRLITFREEFERLLDLYEIEWDKRYVFEFYDLKAASF